MELYQVINSLASSLITLLWTCLDMTVTYTENVVANTQLNFVQELLNPKVACVFKHIIVVPDEAQTAIGQSTFILHTLRATCQ